MFYKIDVTIRKSRIIVRTSILEDGIPSVKVMHLMFHFKRPKTFSREEKE